MYSLAGKSAADNKIMFLVLMPLPERLGSAGGWVHQDPHGGQGQEQCAALTQGQKPQQ